MYEKISIKRWDNSVITNIVKTNEDNSLVFIPEDEANSDYQAYLVWLSEQPKAK